MFCLFWLVICVLVFGLILFGYWFECVGFVCLGIGFGNFNSGEFMLWFIIVWGYFVGYGCVLFVFCCLFIVLWYYCLLLDLFDGFDCCDFLRRFACFFDGVGVFSFGFGIVLGLFSCRLSGYDVF